MMFSDKRSAFSKDPSSARTKDLVTTNDDSLAEISMISLVNILLEELTRSLQDVVELGRLHLSS